METASEIFPVNTGHPVSFPEVPKAKAKKPAHERDQVYQPAAARQEKHRCSQNTEGLQKKALSKPTRWNSSAKWEQAIAGAVLCGPPSLPEEDIAKDSEDTNAHQRVARQAQGHESPREAEARMEAFLTVQTV